MCQKTCYLLKWIHVISDLKIHVKEFDPLNLTCNLSGSNITWNYRGKISFGRVRRLESIMRSASGVYRCNNSTSVGNYTVIVECEWKLIHPCVLSLGLISLDLFSGLIVWILIVCCLWENTDGAEGTIPVNVTIVNLGGTLNIHCEVDATPQEANVTWFFKGRIVEGKHT